MRVLFHEDEKAQFNKLNVSLSIPYIAAAARGDWTSYEAETLFSRTDEWCDRNEEACTTSRHPNERTVNN